MTCNYTTFEYSSTMYVNIDYFDVLVYNTTNIKDFGSDH
jgi:hypothetical protein